MQYARSVGFKSISVDLIYWLPKQGIKEDELPSSELKILLLALTIEKLTQAGYLYIGMDHFSLPEDELSIAQQQGTLHRNFQGYSTQVNVI